MNELKQLRELVVTIEGLLAVLSVRPTDDMAQNALDKAYKQFKDCYENLFNPDKDICEHTPDVKGEEPFVSQESENSQDNATIDETEENVPMEIQEEITREERFEIQEDANNITSDESEMQESDNEGVSVEQQAVSGDPLRVDEMLSRRGAANLRNVFTLNDKFRFRRSLFNNSDADFIDTIDLLNAMKSLDEALSYLYNELHLDEESDDVKDFVAIIRNHFSE